MKVSFIADKPVTSGTAIIPVFKGGKAYGAAKAYLQSLGSHYKNAAKAAGFTGQAGKSFSLYAPQDITASRLIIVGAGDKDKFDAEMFGAKIAKSLLLSGETSLTFHLGGAGISPDAAARAVIGARLASYRFDNYRTKLSADKKPPPNKLYPASYAKRIKALESLGLKVEILGEKKMTSLGMHALVGVGLGSERESKMVIMKWNGGKSGDKPVCLVGKGVTFDTGGISLKPGANMWDMKGDMGGSAAVVGAMHALAARNAKANVIGIVGLVENMPDGKAQLPGDVITSMSGQTIEVQNTDAEGRLVLADALHYARTKYKPKAMINLATLTGAIIISLGHEHAGLFSNNDDLATQILAASDTTTEKTWRLPLGPHYDRLIDSPNADMKNIGGRGAGSITAAQFLQRFVGNTPWAHLDIAGTGMKNARHDPREPAFATGFGARLLNRWVADNYER